MPWLKQDDGMAEHPKTKRLVRKRRLLGLAAFGLHDLAMLNSARYLLDGHVPSEFVEDWADRAGLRQKDVDDMLDALLTSGQWLLHESDGWVIHDYLDHNPSRAEVEARRAKDAERKQRGRLSQQHGDAFDGDPGPEPESKGFPHDVRADTARTPHGFRGESDGPVPYPSRPVPTTTDSGPTPNVVELPRNVGPPVSGEGEWGVAP